MEKRRDIRFVAEPPLGKLAKWLRILGFDAIYESEFVSKACYEKERVRLTKTRRAHEKNNVNYQMFITSDHYMEQVRQIINALNITPGDLRPFSRCIRCNRSILPADKDTVMGKVPDYIWESHDSFETCGQCGRIYWPGSHTQQSMDRMKRLFD